MRTHPTVSLHISRTAAPGTQGFLTICRTGVTLVETVIAVTLVTFAASALLTALISSVQVSTDSLHTAIAGGLADQLMDEIAAVKFPSASTPGASGAGRTGYNDLDDYNGYNQSPPKARSGATIGTEGSGSMTTRPQGFQPDPRMLSRYRQQVLVEPIAESGNSWVTVSQSTTMRRVTVTISYTDGQGKTSPLAVQVRIFSNVAVAP